MQRAITDVNNVSTHILAIVIRLLHKTDEQTNKPSSDPTQYCTHNIFATVSIWMVDGGGGGGGEFYGDLLQTKCYTWNDCCLCGVANNGQQSELNR